MHCGSYDISALSSAAQAATAAVLGGFPFISADPVPAHLIGGTRQVIRACPLLALRLEPAPGGSARHAGVRRPG
jgi:hypothetical protein